MAGIDDDGGRGADPAGQGVAARTRFGFAGTPPQLRARWPLQASALPDGGGPANPVFDVPVFRTDPASNMTLQDPPPYNFGQFRPSGDLNDARATANVPNILRIVFRRTAQRRLRLLGGFSVELLHDLARFFDVERKHAV
ncbi:hypothetical protein [Thalassobaculum salexigens]|uniref:hypothetical protein n=1 Tax=Thalassobaculum salexigens TaxID=455360 RepID=UPI00248E1179|nr:hypothetical protein [Thalassobaculum salexigens]